MKNKGHINSDNFAGEYQSKPLLLIVMGVSGCGKSTIAKILSEEKKMFFLEADEFHSAAAKQLMATGIPLNDAMREPWIAAICNRLTQMQQQNKNCILSYSGLRKNHRQQFRQLGFETIFLFLSASEMSIVQRLDQRPEHFFNKELLASQFEALEIPSAETDVILIDVECSLEEANKRVREAIKSKLSNSKLSNHKRYSRIIV